MQNVKKGFVSPVSTVNEPNAVLDISSETCPMTFVRTRLALDRLNPGDLLLVLLTGNEPVLEVPRAAEALGHNIVSMTQEGELTRLLIRRHE